MSPAWHRRVAGLGVALMTVALAHSCAKAPPPVVTPGAPEERPGGTPAAVRVLVDERGAKPVVRALPLEEYVSGCVDAELGRLDIDSASAARIRRVQAVLCRTFAMANLGRHAADGYDLCSTTHCQLYRRLPAESLTAREAREATAATSGLVLVFDGRPIQALYHSNCGGRTSRADAVWDGPARPYLTTVSDPPCEKSAMWRSAIDRDRLRQALASDARTNPGARLDQVAVAARDEAGRAASVAIKGGQSRSVRGETFRMVVTLALGVQALRSTMFSVRREGNDFVFEGRGSGHGVGLCQAGAIAQARAGRSDTAILAYYYPGTQLTSSGRPR